MQNIKMPMGIFDTLVNNAAELGDDWGKQLTGSMANSIEIGRASCRERV